MRLRFLVVSLMGNGKRHEIPVYTEDQSKPFSKQILPACFRLTVSKIISATFDLRSGQFPSY